MNYGHYHCHCLPRRARHRLLTVALLALFIVSSASAATRSVPSQYATIQAAVTAAAAGDTVLVAAGTYIGAGNRDIDLGGKSLTVTSQAGAGSTIIDCGGFWSPKGEGNHRGFYIHSGEANVTISGFTIKNGYETYVFTVPNSGVGGGIFNYNSSGSGTITLTGCVLAANTAQDGGGIYNENRGTTTLIDCSLSANTAEHEGGGIYNDNRNNSAISLTDCVLSTNAAQVGGGIFNININGAAITLTNCTLSANTAQDGGGLSSDNRDGCTTTLVNDILYGDIGGEIYNSEGPAPAASFSDIQGGYPGTRNIDADPLFINAAYGDLHLKTGSPCFGKGNPDGAPATDLDGRARPNPPSVGAYEIGTVLNVPSQSPTIQAGVDAALPGDAVLVADGTYTGPGNRDIDFHGKSLTVASQNGPSKTIIDCGGYASTDGSGNHRGFYLHSGEADVTISGFTIKNGYEVRVLTIPDSGSGGGVYKNNYDSGGTFTLTDCILTANTAQDGGGVYNGNGNSLYTYTYNGTTTLTDCTLAANAAQDGGGGVYNYNNGGGGTITLTDCAITANTSRGGGGGVLNNNFSGSSTFTLNDCTLTANTAQSGGGVYNINYLGSGTLTLTDCTLTANAAHDGGGIYGYRYNFNFGGPDAVTLTNDILYGDMGGEIFVDGVIEPPLVSYCDVQGGYPGTNNLNADPLFVNASLGDFHPQPGSPCLGAGIAVGSPSTDKDGKTRPDPPSIGAYEVAAAGHTHVLWNNSDGRVLMWSIAADGTRTQNTFGPYTDGSPSTPWSAKALATGPDDKSHILWTNPDGRVILWTVNDVGSFTYAVYGPYTDDGTAATPWSAAALSVGPDNTVHILWTNPDHRVILWNVDGTFNFTHQVYGPYDDGAPNTFWSATAIATGPDNVTRLVWNNPDGRVILWNVNNAFQFTYHVYGPYNDGAPNTPWSASAVSVGPDNVTHLLWNNPDGRVILWNVDSAFNFTLAAFGPYTDGSANTPWGATALATGPDGLSHLLWTNPDDRVILWGVDSAFNFTSALYGPYTDGAPQNVWSATAISAGP